MKIYKCNINDVTENELNKMYRQMNDERKMQVDCIRIENKKKEKIIADYLCRKAVSEFESVSSECIVFEKNNYGKPFAKDVDIHFSISHSDGLVVCAVSKNEIGIDIEKIRPVKARLAEKFASESEKDVINSRINGLFEIWTLKEAYFKCIGTGINSDIKSVVFDISDDKITCNKSGYEFSFHDIEDGYICSVCIKGQNNF